VGLFSSNRSKTDSNVNTYNFANYNTGEAGAGGSPNINVAGLTLGESASVQITGSDYGAIEAGRSLAQSALDSGGQTFERALSFVQQSNRDNTEALRATTDNVVSKSLGIATANQTPEGSQLLDAVKQIAIGVVVAIVIGVIAKGSKS